MKLNEVTSRKGWVVVHLGQDGNSFANADDTKIEGVFTSKLDAEYCVATAIYGFFGQEVEDEDKTKLDELYKAKPFNFKKFEKFCKTLESSERTGHVPPYDEMREEFAIKETKIFG